MDNKKKFILVLITLDLIYLFFEVALNASVLELASGLVITQDKIDTIESFGRTLSGVGLALTIFSFVKLPQGAFAKAGTLALICLFSIPFMHQIQNYIVDEIIVAKSTPESRGNAELIVTYRDGMTLGVSDLGDAIPFNKSEPTQPEELAMTSIFALSIFNDHSAKILRKDYEYFSEIKMSESTDTLKRLYPHYKELSDSLKKAMEVNNSIVGGNSTQSPEVRIAVNETFNELKSVAEKTYPEIKKVEKEAFEVLISRLSDDKAIAYMFKSCFSGYGSSCNRISRRIRHAANTESIVKHGDVRENIRQVYCKDRCPRNKKEFARKILLEDKNVYSAFRDKYGFLPLRSRNLEEYMGSGHFFDITSDDVADKLNIHFTAFTGVFCSRNNTGGYGKGYSEIKRCLGEVIVENKALVPNIDDYELPSFLKGDFRYSERTLLKHKEVVSLYKELMSHYYIPISSLNMSESEFVAMFNSSRNKAYASNNIENLAASNQRDFREGGDREREGELYIKALYVPPIALFFSLFFTLATVARVSGRFYTLAYFGQPNTAKRSKWVSALMLCTVIFIPLCIMDNKFTSDESIARLELLKGTPYTALEKVTVHWTLVVQPLIYRFGEPIIRDFGFEKDRW
jgi:hypothetical protein